MPTEVVKTLTGHDEEYCLPSSPCYYHIHGTTIYDKAAERSKPKVKRKNVKKNWHSYIQFPKK